MNSVKYKKQKGFTLIELVIVGILIGTLSMVTMSKVDQYALRGSAQEGVALLKRTQIHLEQFFQDNRTYIDGCSNINLEDLTKNVKTFDLTCETYVNGYDLIAVGKKGITYTLSSNGDMATTSAPSNWNTSSSCWVINKDGTCLK